MGYFLKRQRGLLMVKDCFNLSGSIINCRGMQANAGIWRPMHLAKFGDFLAWLARQSKFGWQEHKYFRHHPLEGE
jgi:hypothetical protein